MTAGGRTDLKVGFACNNRCVFCAQGHKREGCARVSFEQLVERMASMRPRATELVLTGGEPTLHPQIIELVEQARDLGYERVQVQTNGRRLAYDPFIDGLIAAGVTEFSPALHGPNARIHDELTRAPGSFNQTVKGIVNVVRRGMPIVTNSVVVTRNTPHLAALVDLLGRLGVRQAQLAFVHPVGTALEMFDQVVPRLSQVETHVREARRVAVRRRMKLVTEAMPLCFLRNMGELAVESTIPDTTVIDLDGAPFDYSRWRPEEGKAHGPPCDRCVKRDRCEGPWREYPEAFGWDEFIPFDKEFDESAG